MQVKFNNIEEFCQELKLETDNLCPKLVRTTKKTAPSSMSPSIKHLSVVATFSTVLRTGELCIVRLEYYCGDLWGYLKDVTTKDRAEESLKQIEEFAKALGIEVRAGVFLESETKKGKEVAVA